MIRDLLPALQAAPPHPLLRAVSGPDGLYLDWDETPAGQMCDAAVTAADAEHIWGCYSQYAISTRADAVVILATLTPHELTTVQLHAPAAVRGFVIANLNLATP